MNRSWRKSLTSLSFFLLGVFLLALAGCGGGKQTSPSESAQTQSKQVELTFWNNWTQPIPEHQILLKRVESFQNEYPDIKIKMDTIPHDQYKIKIKTQAAGKQLPDMFQVWPGAELEPLVKGGVVAPIDDLVNEWKDQLIPADQLADYAIDGKQYAIPGVVVYTHLIYYDKDILSSVGYEEFPKTYEELKDLIRKLRERGITPIALGNKAKWVLQSCYASMIGDRMTGSDFLPKVLSGEKTFTDPDFIRSLEIIKELTDLKAFNEDMNSIDNIQQRDYFYQGKAAMFIEGTWVFGDVMEKAGDRKIGLAVFPTIEGGKGDPRSIPGVTGDGIAINSNLTPEKKEAAYTFLKYFYHEDLYKELLAGGVLVPAQVNPPEDAADLFKNELMPLVSNSKISPVYDAVLPAQLTDIINNGLQAITVGGTTPQGLAEEMQNALGKLNK
ncbi:MAG: extracellular solute-binding protein [Hydrogenibacillus sp.]|nr:extracellular solute-binding protein [Hydrogenibacillus sp.]